MPFFKKLDVNDDCSTKSNKFDQEDWNDWLNFIKIYSSSYSIASIINNKPPNDVRPYATISVCGDQLFGLLDSGSAVSILGNDFHQHFLDAGFQMQECDKSLNFTAAGGQILSASGFINLPVIFEDRFHVLKFYVIPSVQTSIILGVDFWAKYEIIPKFTKSITFSKDSSFEISGLSENHKMIHSYDELSDHQRTAADNVIKQFEDISTQKHGLGRTSLITHRIDTGNSPPIRQRYYRMSPEKIRILCSELDSMLELGVVEECESPWSSPVLIVRKKDGSPRFCLDSRKLNSVTKKDAYKLPYISAILDNLKNAKYLSSIDLSKSFWQTSIQKEDRDKTAFYIPTRGTYRFVTMPFGLTNAPATQQRLVDSLFYGPEFENSVFAFVDDIVISTPDFESHISMLLKVLQKLKMANLTINLEKSSFFRGEIKYLGYVVNSKGLQVDPSKVDAILNFPTPSNKKEVKRFLGTASWYRRFVPNFSSIAGPLNKLTSSSKKSGGFIWTKEAEESFNKLKECLISAPILSCPDFQKPFEVHTDASDFGVGAMLTQTIDDVEHPIAYMSKSLSAQERNYSITEREALAVLVALEHWRCYLDNGHKFTVFTDHSALKWFLNLNNPTGRLARWGVRLSAFNFEIKHRRGSDNVIPDALSRACPISAIDTNPYDPYNTTDDWYRNIFNGCQNNPTSFPNFTIKNKRLYRFMKAKCSLHQDFQWKEVLPLEARQDCIIKNHASPTAGHFGVMKTYKRLALNYYWPGMYADVVKAVTSCDTCISFKHQTHAPLGEMGDPKICNRPFQIISVDLVGPLPPTRKQNCFILVVTCCFSKYCLLFPIRRATAEIITRILEENVLLVHGIPSTIIMDNGKQFVSATLKQMLSKYNVANVHFTPKYSPHVNTVERYNKTIITAISTFISNDQRIWDQLVPKIQFAINNAVNEVTGYTPSFLVHGRELITCGSLYADAEFDDEVIYQPRDQYATNLGSLSGVFDKVQLALLSAHAKNQTTYNLRRRTAEFNVGDTVWKRTFYLSDKDKYFTKKLAPKFTKCIVIDKKSPLVYELADMNGKSLGFWHIKDIKLINYKD